MMTHRVFCSFVFVIGITVVTFFLAACADMGPGMQNFMMPTATVSGSSAPVMRQQREPYNGPKARVTVMAFENKTGVYSEHSASGTTIQTGAANAPERPTYTDRDPLGSGMRDQLVTALAQTGAFIILEREKIQDVLAEQDFGRSGRVRQETAATVGEVEGADFLIYGAVTEYQASQASAAGGVGHGLLPRVMSDPTVASGRVFSQVLAQQAIGGMFNQDHVAIDLRLVDARTGRIVAATAIEGKARDLGLALSGQFGQTLLDMGGQYQTPIQKAIRACMIRAANWIAEHSLPGVIHSNGQMAAPAAGPATGVNVPANAASTTTQQ